LFAAREANRDTYTDDPTGCQLIWVASASTSIIPTIALPDALPGATHSDLSWLGTGIELRWIAYLWLVSAQYSTKLEMWANAQRDGRPAEYRWRPLFNAAKFG